MIAWLIARGVSRTAAPFIAWGGALFAVIAIAALMVGLITHDANKRVEQARQIDSVTFNADAYARDLQATQAASANQQQADDEFRNSQDNLKEKTDDAARNRTSAIDALFDELR